ncbi:MAG: hypothetical protein DRR00_32795, partial [Candidatus Parabeggiatoa sp. nov. 3]
QQKPVTHPTWINWGRQQKPVTHPTWINWGRQQKPVTHPTFKIKMVGNKKPLPTLHLSITN